MKLKMKEFFLLPALMAGIGLMTAGRVTAQPFTILHSFAGGSDGASPRTGLVLSGDAIYGTTEGNGGDGVFGTIFVVNTDGTGFKNLHSFTGDIAGAYPRGTMILSDDILFGTVLLGGDGLSGTVSAINTDGVGFTNLYNFTGADDGSYPRGGVVISGDTLYGTASGGGSSGIYGSVFAVHTNGAGFINLHSFTATSGGLGSGTNSDGANPEAGVILSGDTLYGTALYGGSSGVGTVFAISTNGAGFTNLHSFNATSDGAYPSARLVIAGNRLYGTTAGGGSSDNGTVFALNTDGTDFTTLHSFTAVSSSFPYDANSDGANPFAGLIISGNTLYGTAQRGGDSGYGVIFALDTNGTVFTTLYNFTGDSDGANPLATLVLSGNNLYGTAQAGGSSGYGTVFSFSLGLTSVPQLTIVRSAANVILMWPTNITAFTLQSATNLIPPTSWNTNLPAPVVVNGQNTVTNPISGTQQFYRLAQ